MARRVAERANERSDPCTRLEVVLSWTLFFLGTVLNGCLPACFARRGPSLACIHRPHHSRWTDSSQKRSLVGSPAALPSFIRRQSAVKSNNWPGRLGRRLATSVIQQGSEQPPLMNGEFFFCSAAACVALSAPPQSACLLHCWPSLSLRENFFHFNLVGRR